MGKYDSFTERPVISYEVFKENKELLKKVLDVFIGKYSALAEYKKGMITVSEMNRLIDGTVDSFDNDMKEIQIIEGFCEMIMSMLKQFGNSKDTFKAVKKMFKFK